jgi:hypothetical protein
MIRERSGLNGPTAHHNKDNGIENKISCIETGPTIGPAREANTFSNIHIPSSWSTTAAAIANIDIPSSCTDRNRCLRRHPRHPFVLRGARIATAAAIDSPSSNIGDRRRQRIGSVLHHWHQFDAAATWRDADSR